MADRLSINIKIDGRTYPLKVRKEEEESYRKAAKTLNEIILQYRQTYPSRDTQDFLAMTAFQFVLKNVELENKKDQTPVIEEIKKLNERLADYLSLNE